MGSKVSRVRIEEGNADEWEGDVPFPDRVRPPAGPGREKADSGGESQHTSDGDRADVAYDPGPDYQGLSERYRLEFSGNGTADRLQRLEQEFGRERVSRWADEGMPVKAMGKPRDMRAFRASRDDQPAAGQIQPRLEVSSPADPAEREAERVAESVLEMDEATSEDSSAVSVHRSPGDRTAATEPLADAQESQLRSSVTGGSRLPPETQSYFESRMRRDFSDVRVHTDSAADQAARSIHAKAFTLGTDIAFAKGQYAPGSESGTKLLAHELTHTIQQGGADRIDRQGENTPQLLNKAAPEWAVELADYWSEVASFGAEGVKSVLEWFEANTGVLGFFEKIGNTAEAVGLGAKIVAAGKLVEQGEIQEAVVEMFKMATEGVLSVDTYVDTARKVVEFVFGKIPYMNLVANTLKNLQVAQAAGASLDGVITLVRQWWSNWEPATAAKLSEQLTERMYENYKAVYTFNELLFGQFNDLAKGGYKRVVDLVDTVISYDLGRAEMELFLRRCRNSGYEGVLALLEQHGKGGLQNKAITGGGKAKGKNKGKGKRRKKRKKKR